MFRRSFLSKKKLFTKDIKDRRTPAEVINRLKIESVHFESREKLGSSRGKGEYSQLLWERRGERGRGGKKGVGMGVGGKKTAGEYGLGAEKIIKRRRYFLDDSSNNDVSMNLEPW